MRQKERQTKKIIEKLQNFKILRKYFAYFWSFFFSMCLLHLSVSLFLSQTHTLYPSFYRFVRLPVSLFLSISLSPLIHTVICIRSEYIWFYCWVHVTLYRQISERDLCCCKLISLSFTPSPFVSNYIFLPCSLSFCLSFLLCLRYRPLFSRLSFCLCLSICMSVFFVCQFLCLSVCLSLSHTYSYISDTCSYMSDTYSYISDLLLTYLIVLLSTLNIVSPNAQ